MNETDNQDQFNEGVYVLYDKLAQAIVGGLHLHKHEATALRMFSDIITMNDSRVAQHPKDFDLCRIGFYNPITHQLTTDFATLMNAQRWIDAQQPKEQ